MKSITIFSVLILTLSLIFGGITNSVYAQDTPSILLTIAKRAQTQIQNQIADSSDHLKQKFEDGRNEVNALEEALANDDLNSAKKHFLAAMKIFTEISRQLTSSQSTQTEVTPTQNNVKNPTSDLLRMYGYVNNLKTIAKNQNSTVDFSSLDELFQKARQQIANKEFSDASETIREIKNTILEINNELRQNASQKESNRAQSFAQKYIKQIERLIEHSQQTGKSEEIIQKLESAKESLISSETPAAVIKEVRNILILQQQFELSEGRLLELRVMQIEKTIEKLSSESLSEDNLNHISQTLDKIKQEISTSNFEQATESLRSLTLFLQELEI